MVSMTVRQMMSAGLSASCIDTVAGDAWHGREEYIRVMETKPTPRLTQPIPPCNGWLIHSQRDCDCCAEARDRARSQHPILDWFADRGMPFVIAGLIVAASCGVAAITG